MEMKKSHGPPFHGSAPKTGNKSTENPHFPHLNIHNTKHMLYIKGQRYILSKPRFSFPKCNINQQIITTNNREH